MTRSSPRATTKSAAYGERLDGTHRSGVPAMVHACAARASSSDATTARCPLPGTRRRRSALAVHRTRVAPLDRSKYAGAPSVSSVPTIAGAFGVVMPSRRRKSMVTATSVCEPGSGRRPASTRHGQVVDASRGRSRSPSRRSGRPSARRSRGRRAGSVAGGTTSIGVAMIGNDRRDVGQSARSAAARRRRSAWVAGSGVVAVERRRGRARRRRP